VDKDDERSQFPEIVPCWRYRTSKMY